MLLAQDRTKIGPELIVGGVQRSYEDSACIPKPNSDDPSYLTIPRPRIVKRDGEKTERRRLEMENLRSFTKRMDKKMQQKHTLFNIYDL